MLGQTHHDVVRLSLVKRHSSQGAPGNGCGASVPCRMRISLPSLSEWQCMLLSAEMVDLNDGCGSLSSTQTSAAGAPHPG